MEDALQFCLWHVSRNFFWNPASTVLEWEREPVLGSGSWSKDEENSYQPRKVLDRIQFGKLQIHLVRIGCFLCDLLYGIPMVCQLDCFLNRARKVWNIFI